MTEELITAVDALTRPSRTKVIRDDGSTVVVEHDALLVQLEAAVTSGVTGNGGGSGEPTGILVDSASLHRLLLISSQIGDWCRIARVRPTRQPTADLARWLVVAVGYADTDFYVRTLHGWATTIHELLDPPKRVPLADPCVSCKADRYVTSDGDERRYPVVVEYDPAVLHASLRATCRSCDAEWVGPDAVAELVEEMKERTG